MNIRPNHELRNLFVAKVKESLRRNQRTATEIHVSDVLTPRKAYWQRELPDLDFTDQEVGYFFTGRGLHATVVEVMTGIQGSEEVSHTDQETGIIWSPDLDELRGEFKTCRFEHLPKDEDEALHMFAEYAKQCKAYAALARIDYWHLLVYFLVLHDKKDWRRIATPRAYTLTFTEQELQEERERLKLAADDLRKTYEDKEYTRLPLCDQFKCYKVKYTGKYRGHKQLEPQCKYWDSCKPEGRYGTDPNKGPAGNKSKTRKSACSRSE